mmetsp:Transcript_36037/g.90425  ORF Transcript_36037/g.90425 Transcript_36037/m.90425 type:complete len:327 (+) Transcript_36037:98-1078(+)
MLPKSTKKKEKHVKPLQHVLQQQQAQQQLLLQQVLGNQQTSPSSFVRQDKPQLFANPANVSLQIQKNEVCEALFAQLSTSGAPARKNSSTTLPADLAALLDRRNQRRSDSLAYLAKDALALEADKPERKFLGLKGLFTRAKAEHKGSDDAPVPAPPVPAPQHKPMDRRKSQPDALLVPTKSMSAASPAPPVRRSKSKAHHTRSQSTDITKIMKIAAAPVTSPITSMINKTQQTLSSSPAGAKKSPLITKARSRHTPAGHTTSGFSSSGKFTFSQKQEERLVAAFNNFLANRVELSPRGRDALRAKRRAARQRNLQARAGKAKRIKQ